MRRIKDYVPCRECRHFRYKGTVDRKGNRKFYCDIRGCKADEVLADIRNQAAGGFDAAVKMLSKFEQMTKAELVEWKEQDEVLFATCMSMTEEEAEEDFQREFGHLFDEDGNLRD